MAEETIAFPDLGLIEEVEALLSTLDLPRDALFLKFRIATRTCSELDREILAKQTA